MHGSRRGKVRSNLLAGGISAGLAVVLAVSALFATDSQQFTGSWLVLLVAMLVFVYRMDALNIVTAYWAPWLLMLAFSLIDISAFHRPVSIRTVVLVVGTLLAASFVLEPSHRIRVVSRELPKLNGFAYDLTAAIFLSFCLLNVVLAGYVPLLSAIWTGDSGYTTFGVKGVYGLFNAFANAFGVASFFLWKRTGRPKFKYYFLSVAVAFVLFVTRQNLISLVVECFVVYSLAVRRVPMVKLVAGLVLLLTAFSAAGDFREALPISDLVKIDEAYSWLPNAFVWVYAYFYFNLLNLDNIVSNSPGAAFDGSSLLQLIPSFARPELEGSGDTLEVSYFTANPFISSLYRDIGFVGVLLAGLLLAVAARLVIRKIHGRSHLFGLGAYSTMVFCFLFSFFENFFFFLPIISQIAFFGIFEWAFFERRKASRNRTGPAVSGTRALAD